MGAQQLLLRRRGPEVNITARSVVQTDSVVAPATANATASYSLRSDGVLRLNAATDISGEWLGVGGSAANYEVRFTHLSGTAPAGVTYGAWLNLGTTRTFTQNATRFTNGFTSVTGDVRVEIGRAGLATALDTADITITAEAERSP